MIIDPSFIPFILVGGGIMWDYLPIHILPLCAFLPLVECQGIGCRHFIGTTLLDAYP